MRRGELVALQKCDVDLTSNKPTITGCRWRASRPFTPVSFLVSA